MPRIIIEVSDADAKELKDLVARMNQQSDIERGTTHGKMTIKKLVTMLAEDAALAERRPGSWEGANMCTVLQSHGYQV